MCWTAYITPSGHCQAWIALHGINRSMRLCRWVELGEE
jgi:hypothetical protein